jgi:hypothetical protein
VTNNIILNNSFHLHVWYPNSGDVIKQNIVYGAYQPILMDLAMGPDDKWGSDIDSNLFVTNELERFMYSGNDCDARSLVGDPLFTGPESGDFTVSQGSPALRVGFRNFGTGSFGVVSEKLKRLSKKPEIPRLQLRSDTGSQIFEWQGFTVKNIETIEEQSAVGQTEAAGVLVLRATENASVAGLRPGDVILRYNGHKADNLQTLMALSAEPATNANPVLDVLRSQRNITLTGHEK